MKKITWLSMVLFSFASFAQDSISVLFIGNSYTYVNDLPTVLSNLTVSLGDKVTIDSKTNGGYTFQNHLSDPATHVKVKSKPWDYVVLQGQSQEPSFPTDQVNNQTLPPAMSLADSVYKNWYCSQAMYFMTWGRQNGDAQWDSINTFDKMNARLRNAYLRFSDSVQGCVSPVGVSWKYVRDNYPTINLYSSDGSHPSVEGTYLAACTFYASLFRKSPVGAPYVAGIDPVVAGYLQNAAELAVLDSLSTWHLRATEDIAIAQFNTQQNGNSVNLVNQSWRATSYSWDFGDGTVGNLQNESHVYSMNGTYTIQLIAINECGSDTATAEIVVNSAELASMENSVLTCTFENDSYKISFLKNTILQGAYITDASGKTIQNAIQEVDKETSQLFVNLSSLPSGVYYCNIEFDSQKVTLKLSK